MAAAQSNKFAWSDYSTPRYPLEEEGSIEAEPEADALSSKQDDDADRHFLTLRHLKQGATGATKTWPVAEVLLDYLVRHGGLFFDTNSKNESPLDLTGEPPNREKLLALQQEEENGDPVSSYNVLELGAGTGLVGIGLALSLNTRADPKVLE
jgi:hypothetical protein